MHHTRARRELTMAKFFRGLDKQLTVSQSIRLSKRQSARQWLKWIGPLFHMATTRGGGKWNVSVLAENKRVAPRPLLLGFGEGDAC